MSPQLVDKELQLRLIDEALAANRLEQAADELITLLGGKYIKHGQLAEEGHVARILNTIAEREPALAVTTAERALKVMPSLARAAPVDMLLGCAAHEADNDRGLALAAMLLAAKYTKDDSERREKTVRQYADYAVRWQPVDVRAAFEAAAQALAFAHDNPGLQQEIEPKLRALNLPGLSV